MGVELTEKKMYKPVIYDKARLDALLGGVKAEHPVTKLINYLKDTDSLQKVSITMLKPIDGKCTAQVTLGSFKTTGSGETRKEAKQNAAAAMLHAQANKGKGASALKHHELKALQQAQQPKKPQTTSKT